MARLVSSLLLISSNIIPVLGILLWDWDLFTLLLLYWGELMISGVFAYLKLIKVTGTRWNEETKTTIGTVAVGGLVYFIFIAIVFSGVLVYDPSVGDVATEGDATELILMAERTITALKEIWWPLILMVISHGLSYLLNFLGRGEYRAMSAERLGQLMGWRMVPLHLAILAGCFLVFDGRDPTLAAILILMGVKTIGDLLMHSVEHHRPVISK